MASRRGNGEGTIYQEKASGLWAAALWIETPTGKTRKVMRGKTRAAVATKLTQAQAAAADGQVVLREGLTVQAWMDYWLANIVKHEVEPVTLSSYRRKSAGWIYPHVGHYKLTQLAPEHVQDMMTALGEQKANHGDRTLTSAGRQARMILGKALRAAVRYGKVARIVTQLVSPPTVKAYRLEDALEAPEARAVLQAASGNRLEALAALVLTMGLRQDEALSLRWDHVDLVAGTLMVVKAKTDAGIRTLELPSFMVSHLAAHQIRQRLERMSPRYAKGDAGLVFTNTVGRKMDPRSCLRWWHNLTIAAGVGRRRMHASRHTAATLLLEAGVPLEVISKMLGHASLAITADIYAKVKPQAMRAAAESLAGVLTSA